MIKPVEIPDEVVQSFIKANNGCECGDCVRVAIAAAINAWPGEFAQIGYNGMEIVLPIPQEKNDD